MASRFLAEQMRICVVKMSSSKIQKRLHLSAACRTSCRSKFALGLCYHTDRACGFDARLWYYPEEALKSSVITPIFNGSQFIRRCVENRFRIGLKRLLSKDVKAGIRRRLERVL
jgi:hypothetical protein